MTRISVQHSTLPSSLETWMLLDGHGLPRYWPMVWQTLYGASLERSTLGRHLSAIDRLYSVVAEQTGHDCLDSLLTAGEIYKISLALQSFFSILRNEAAQRTADNTKQWRAALDFVRSILTGLSGNTKDFDALEARLGAIDILYASLRPGDRKRRSARVRALPASVVEDLYELTDPSSPRNPFRLQEARWRFYVLLLMLLQQGLRRGEAGLLAAKAIHDGLDPESGEPCFWINIKNLEGEEDPRYERPGIKTAQSFRQIPIASDLAEIIDFYVNNFRGRQNHPFLFSSSWGKPLSLRAMNYAFAVMSDKLSPTALKDLNARNGVAVITPHDLRHTCAVARLSEFVASGTEMKLALQNLRSFFGWSKDSEMPNHYAAAYFEDRLRTTWRGKLDDRTNILRELWRIERNAGVISPESH